MKALDDFFGTYGADTLTVLAVFVFAIVVVGLAAWVTWRDRKRGN